MWLHTLTPVGCWKSYSTFTNATTGTTGGVLFNFLGYKPFEGRITLVCKPKISISQLTLLSTFVHWSFHPNSNPTWAKKTKVLAHIFFSSLTNDSERWSLEKVTRNNLTKVFHWLDCSTDDITFSPGEEGSRCVGGHTSSIKELLLHCQMLLDSPTSVDTIKFHVFHYLVSFPKKWVWHNNVSLGEVCSHSNDMRFAGIWGLLLLQASSRFLCQMMAENLDPVWNL